MSPSEAFNQLSPCPGNIELPDGREIEVTEWRPVGNDESCLVFGIDVEIKGRIRLKPDNSLTNGNA